MAGGGLLWKVVGTGAAVGAGIAARKGITATWHAAMGTPPPTNPEDPDVTWQEAVGWAVLSGAAVGVARLLATRKAADYWRRSTGSLPKGLQSVTP
ncbi:MAG: DUF4235 domain-containing protein [Motilibacteraceae bacterium]